MDIIQKTSEVLLSFSAKLGPLMIPIVFLASFILLAFAKYSYKLFKIILPVAAGIFVALATAKYLAPTVAKIIPGLAEKVHPSIISAGLIAVLVAIICYKLHVLTVLIVATGLGYTAVSWVVHKLLRTMDFVNKILWYLTMPEAVLFSTVVSVVCAIFTVYFFYRHFRKTYIIVTAIPASVISFALLAIFLFGSFPFATLATLIAAGIGLIVGIVLCDQQLVDTVY